MAVALLESGHVPQRVGGKSCAGEGAAVAEGDNEQRQVLDLETVVKRVAEAMRPVEERQRNQDEEIELDQRRLHQGEAAVVGDGVEPPQRKGDAGQKEMNWKKKCGHGPTRAEQTPQKRRYSSSHFNSV